MKLCMFSPADRALERGWPGRIDGEHVTQLAAQTLQSFFTGGGKAREHAAFRLRDVRLRAPVLHPPSVRLFDGDGTFAFGNPASMVGPDAEIPVPAAAAELRYERRIGAVIGAGGQIGGFTQVVLWIAPGLPSAKNRDFATALGPVVVTPDELEPPGRWAELMEHAAENTRLCPGDLLADAPFARGGPVHPGEVVECALEGVGVLRMRVAQPAAAS